MTKEYRIAHLSDLHLSPEYFPERTHYFRSILQQCAEMDVDHIIITGDITNQARGKEFQAFREIAGEFSLLSADKMTVVVGNHDIFGGPYHAEDVLNFPSMCKAADYDSKLKEFYSAAKETFDGTKFFSPKSVFPFVKFAGDIAIVAVNSVARWHPLKNPLGSNGTVDDHQFEAIRTILKSPLLEGKRILVAVHHHFNKMEDKGNSKLERLWMAIESTTMKMYGKKKLLKMFRKADVHHVLHGHVHTNNEYKRHGIRCMNAGGTVIPAKNQEQAFHLLTFRSGSFHIQSVPVRRLAILRDKRSRKRISLRPALAKA